VIEKINAVRVWPKGFHGIFKRARYGIRMILFSNFFNSFYTFIAVLNAILLSISYYGMGDELEFILDEISGYFTRLFIPM
jgi:hypothetical protein